MIDTLPFFLVLTSVMSIGLAEAQPGTGSTRFLYSRLPDLPPQQGRANPGVAGAFAGVSNGALLIAGGANFPNGYPWQNGTKVWQSTIYVLTQKGNRQSWQTAGTLEKPIAYGASAGWNEQLICLGGNDASGRYADAFTLTWDTAANRLKTGTLPKLPLALANHSAAVVGDVLFVFGGESDQGTEKSLYALNLKNPATGWRKRPDLPGSARAFTTLVVQNNGLYVLGGRETINGKTTVFKDAYRFDPEHDNWLTLPDMPVPLAAHGAIPGGPASLLIFGGDDGVRLGEIEGLTKPLSTLPDGAEKAALTKKRNALQSDHPGFRREVWQFHTDTRIWSVVDTLPFATPVTTPIIRRGNRLIIPSGEVAPGIRTPGIWQITLPKHH